MQQTSLKVGFIGLGAMGEPMTRNLAKAGFLYSVWNRTLHKAETLATELSVSCAESVSELAKEVDIVLLCVSADSDVLEMVDAVAHTIKPGAVIIDMSTVSSATAIKAAQLLAAKQVDFLDAPVSGGVEGAKNGTLAIMLGGDVQVLHSVYPILEAMSSVIQHMGPTGFGQATKAVNQMLAAGINQAVTEALAFAETQDLPMQELIKVISGGAAGNWFLTHRGPTMTEGIFAPGFKLALHYKDLKICQSMAAQSDLETDLLDKTVHDYQLLIEQGFGDEDISALYRNKRR